jgi:hypothetical protein
MSRNIESNDTGRSTFMKKRCFRHGIASSFILEGRLEKNQKNFEVVSDQITVHYGMVSPEYELEMETLSLEGNADPFEVAMKRAQELAVQFQCAGRTILSSFYIERSIVAEYDGQTLISDWQPIGAKSFFGSVVSVERVLELQQQEHAPTARVVSLHQVRVAGASNVKPLEPIRGVEQLDDLEAVRKDPRIFVETDSGEIVMLASKDRVYNLRTGLLTFEVP